MKNPVYVHFGCTKFEPHKFEAIRNNSFPSWYSKKRIYETKPSGGLWASRSDAPYGWKQWCEEQRFRICVYENAFSFRLKDGAKIGRIDAFNPDNLPLVKTPSLSGRFPVDFEACVAAGYDALELSFDFPSSSLEPAKRLDYEYWDCESTLILNPDCIVVEPFTQKPHCEFLAEPDLGYMLKERLDNEFDTYVSSLLKEHDAPAAFFYHSTETAVNETLRSVIKGVSLTEYQANVLLNYKGNLLSALYYYWESNHFSISDTEISNLILQFSDSQSANYEVEKFIDQYRDLLAPTCTWDELIKL